MYTTLVALLGWTGAGMLLLAYALASLNHHKRPSALYQFLNIFGSAFLIVNAVYYGVYPSAFVNTVWIAIALMSIAGVRTEERSNG
jgi:hypothetical protein